MPVHLYAGWAWDCPSCQHRNIAYGDFEPDADTVAQAREEFGKGPCQLVMWPEEVTCAKCLASHPSEEPANWLGRETDDDRDW